MKKLAAILILLASMTMAYRLHRTPFQDLLHAMPEIPEQLPRVPAATGEGCLQGWAGSLAFGHIPESGP